MKNGKKLAALLLAGAMTAGALTGCGNSGGGSASGGAEASGANLTEVKWVSPAALASLDFVWMYVADEMGYFADEGLQVDVIENTDGSDARFLASGSADFAASSPAVALSTVDAGATNIKGFVNNVSSNIFGIACANKSGIKDWKDLEGKKIALTGEALISIYDPILAAAGVDTSKVEYVVLGNARYEALESGAADAMGTWISEYEMCEGMGYTDWTFLSGNDVLPQIANSLWVNTDFAAENPDAVKGFGRAITKAMYFCYKNPEAAADIALNRYPEIECTWAGAVGAVNGNVSGMLGMTPEAVQATLDAHAIGVFDMTIVEQTIENLLAGGSIQQTLDAATCYTNDYVDTTWDYAVVDEDAAAYTCTSKVYTEAHAA